MMTTMTMTMTMTDEVFCFEGDDEGDDEWMNIELSFYEESNDADDDDDDDADDDNDDNDDDADTDDDDNEDDDEDDEDDDDDTDDHDGDDNDHAYYNSSGDALNLSQRFRQRLRHRWQAFCNTFRKCLSCC